MPGTVYTPEHTPSALQERTVPSFEALQNAPPEGAVNVEVDSDPPPLLPRLVCVCVLQRSRIPDLCSVKLRHSCIKDYTTNRCSRAGCTRLRVGVHTYNICGELHKNTGTRLFLPQGPRCFSNYISVVLPPPAPQCLSICVRVCFDSCLLGSLAFVLFVPKL